MTKEQSSKYPWADWLDGRVWLLRMAPYGNDFDCFERSMQSQVHTWAIKYGLSVVTRVVTMGLLVQAYPTGSTWKPNLGAIQEVTIKRAMTNPR
jgi:hypothetical protein